MRRGRTAVWVLAAASFALAAWWLLPFPARESAGSTAPAHGVSEEPLEASISAG
jgi:hypothetical protein